jgi:hypothetical protein
VAACGGILPMERGPKASRLSYGFEYAVKQDTGQDTGQDVGRVLTVWVLTSGLLASL